MTPEAAVEAAKEAIWNAPLGRLTSEPERDSFARAALEAAAPHMLTQAWDEGSIAGWIESGLPHSWVAENALVKSNPYRPTP